MANTNDIKKNIMKGMYKFQKNKTMQAVTGGMMGTLPITIGVAIFAILGNLPIAAWQKILVDTGLGNHMLDIINATFNITAIYISVAIAYVYANKEKQSGLTAALLSLASFISFMPQTIKFDDKVVNALDAAFLGSQGIFVAIIVGIVIAKLYCALMSNDKLRIKLPDSVPSMVSDSLSPTFVSIIIFTIVFTTRYAISFTSFENIFNFISTIITKPVMNVGLTMWAPLIIFTFMNLCWFFGIHPSPIFGVYVPLIMTAAAANVGAMNAGTPLAELPYYTFMIMAIAVYIGGNGNTLGLAIDMMLFSKSERYKALGKICIIPNIFNINEPLIFGTPIVLNPIYFVPMVLSSTVGAIIGFIFIKMGAVINPAVNSPWVVPSFIAAFLSGGFMLAIMVVCIIIAQAILYLPFFKMSDNSALKEETVKLEA